MQLDRALFNILSVKGNEIINYVLVLLRFEIGRVV